MTAPANHHGLLIVICGPAGVGKSTISNRLKELLGVWYTVSVTTRPKLPGDEKAKTYEHISKQEFCIQAQVSQDVCSEVGSP